MRDLKDRVGEGEHGLTNHFRYECTRRGAQRLGYPPVVAGGNRANTIHYITNDQPLEEGELVLFDGGCEIGGYNSDITRTFPVSGKYSGPQAEVYSAVLEVQKEIVSLCRPHIPFRDLQTHAVQKLTKQLQKLSIPTHSGINNYYPHDIGHWLGMDIHDTCHVREPVLKPGMVITVEPGLYLSLQNHEVPLQYRGIGVRIEDNILITEDGYENLTVDTPKEIQQIQTIMS